MVVIGGGFVWAGGSGFEMMVERGVVGKAVTNPRSLVQINRWQIYDGETGKYSARDQ